MIVLDALLTCKSCSVHLLEHDPIPPFRYKLCIPLELCLLLIAFTSTHP